MLSIVEPIEHRETIERKLIHLSTSVIVDVMRDPAFSNTDRTKTPYQVMFVAATWFRKVPFRVYSNIESTLCDRRMG